MENATKALLIAAAVLITIVLVAVGVLLIGNTSEISDQADKVGDSIFTATGEKVMEIQGGVKLSSDEFKKLLDGLNLPAAYKENRIYASNVWVSGYLFKGYAKKEADNKYKWYAENSDGEGESLPQDDNEMVNEWIPGKLKAGKIKMFKNSGNSNKVKNEYKKYRNSIEDAKTVPIFRLCFLDKDGNDVSGLDKEVMQVVYILAVQK